MSESLFSRLFHYRESEKRLREKTILLKCLRG